MSRWCKYLVKSFKVEYFSGCSSEWDGEEVMEREWAEQKTEVWRWWGAVAEVNEWYLHAGRGLEQDWAGSRWLDRGKKIYTHIHAHYRKQQTCSLPHFIMFSSHENKTQTSAFGRTMRGQEHETFMGTTPPMFLIPFKNKWMWIYNSKIW